MSVLPVFSEPGALQAGSRLEPDRSPRQPERAGDQLFILALQQSKACIVCRVFNVYPARVLLGGGRTSSGLPPRALPILPDSLSGQVINGLS